MSAKSIWSDLEKSYDALDEIANPVMDKTAQELGLDPDYITLVAAVWLFGAQEFNTNDYMRIFPYGLAKIYEERLISAAQKGYLVQAKEGSYRASPLGEETTRKIWRAAGNSIVPLQALPGEKMDRLLAFLEKVAQACLAAPEPPGHFFISHKHENYGKYEISCPLMGFVVQFGALSAYRDDAHLAAWQTLGIAGHAWDLFTRLWRSSAGQSARHLAGQTKHRGITEELVHLDLQDLVERGWVETDKDLFLLTSRGRLVRDKAEAQTETWFYAPWACLSEAELEELSRLAWGLRDVLRSKAK